MPPQKQWRARTSLIDDICGSVCVCLRGDRFPFFLFSLRQPCCEPRPACPCKALLLSKCDCLFGAVRTLSPCLKFDVDSLHPTQCIPDHTAWLTACVPRCASVCIQGGAIVCSPFVWLCACQFLTLKSAVVVLRRSVFWTDRDFYVSNKRP